MPALVPKMMANLIFGWPSGAGAGADLLSHEATFSQSESAKAGIAMHSTAAMAGAFAAQLRARQLVLTHFSARYGNGPPRLAVCSLIGHPLYGGEDTWRVSGVPQEARVTFVCWRLRNTYGTHRGFCPVIQPVYEA